jgi:hypothetical protein
MAINDEEFISATVPLNKIEREEHLMHLHILTEMKAVIILTEMKAVISLLTSFNELVEDLTWRILSLKRLF